MASNGAGYEGFGTYQQHMASATGAGYQSLANPQPLRSDASGVSERRTRDQSDSFGKDRDRGDRDRSGIDHDRPPFSRVFVVCCKSHSADDLRACFEKYGVVEDVWVVKDKHTKENRGVAYIKFSKMSEATLSVEEMDGKMLSEEDEKPLKVIIAQPKASKSTDDFSDDSALTRLFIVIPKDLEEKELKARFEEFGEIEFVQVVKDRKTGERKGFGYVTFRKPHSAALAVENCDKAYKAVMAEPKSHKLKRDHGDAGAFSSHGQGSRGGQLQDLGLNLGIGGPGRREESSIGAPAGISAFSSMSFQDIRSGAAPVSNRLHVIVSPKVNQEDLGRLFDLIPGMEFCDLKKNYTTGESKGYAFVVYNSVGSAIYAKEKLNGFHYPMGCKLAVQYAQDDAVGGDVLLTPKSTPNESSNETENMFSNLNLPPVKPILDPDTDCAERLFIVCNPNALPDHMLRDVFCRFGSLIDVFMLKGKNYGYAKYGTADSADKAIKSLNGNEILGIRLKVMLADPPKTAETARKRPRT